MWASSHMGLRGFRVSLAQTAAKEDYIRGRSIITSCYRRKGGLLPNVVYTGVCRWRGYGFDLCP